MILNPLRSGLIQRDRLRLRIETPADLRRTTVRGAGLVALAVLATGGLGMAGVFVVLVGLLTLTWRRALIGFYGLVILVPCHMYTLPGSLPFEAKPDRVVILPILAFWFLAVLASGRVRARATPLGAPLGIFCCLMVASLIVNEHALTLDGAFGDTLKKNLYFLGFYVTYFVSASVLKPADVPRVLRWIGGFALIVALGTFYARFTGYNVFRSMNHYIPVLQTASDSLGVTYTRQGNGPARMVGSSEHPISFAVVMTMLLPTAVYLVRDAGSRRSRALWGTTAMLVLGGAVLSGTRTSFVGLALVFVLSAAIKPRDIPALCVVGAIGMGAMMVVAPDTIGSVKATILPSNAESQKTNVQGRTEDYGPVLDHWASSPWVGEGFGSFSPVRYFFVDNAWLKLLPDLGVLGLVLLLWMLGRGVAMGWRTARSESPGAAAAGACMIPLMVFAVTGLLYDALDFTQPTYLFFIFAALAAVLDRQRHELALAGAIVPRAWELEPIQRQPVTP